MTRRMHIATLSLTLAVTAACGGKSPEQHIAQASQYLADRDYKSATIELKSVLQQDSEQAEARWLLGGLYLDTGDTASAEKELLRADKLGWNADDVRPALARALLAQGKYEEVAALASTGLQPAAAASVLASQAMAELARGHTSEADALIGRAFEQAPDSLDVKMAEARLMANQGDSTGALIVLEEVLGEAPGLAPAWSLKGDILMGQQVLPESLEAFDKAIALQQNPFIDRLKRAMIELQTQDLEATQTDTTWLLQRAPQHPMSNYLQGMLFYQAGRYDEAVSALSLAEPAANQFPMILFYLSRAHLAVGNSDQAAVFAKKFFVMVPGNIAGRKLLAGIYLQSGKPKEVPELIQPVLDKDPEDVGALSLMANALLSQGDTDEGIALLEKVAELQPDSPMAQVRLGAGLLLSGQREAAAEHLENTLQLNPEFQQADVLLVLNHLQSKEFDKAIEAAEAYRSRHPGDATPYSLLGKVYLAAGRQDDALKALNRALSLSPGDPSANDDLASLAVTAGDLNAARGHYLTILEHQPNYLPALLKLAMLDAREQKEEAMVQRLEQAMEAAPTALQPRLLLARYYLGRGKPDRIAPLFATLDELQKQAPQVLQLLAMGQLSGGENTEAEHTLEQLIAANPSTASSHHLLAMASERNGDRARARAELQRALALDPSYGPSLLAAARMALAERKYDEFDAYLARLIEFAPDAPQVLSLKAAAAQRDGDTNAAIKLASQAFEAAPDTTTLLALVGHQNAGGNGAEAQQQLQQWVNDHPQDIPVRLALAGNLQSANRADDAAAQYIAVLALDPDNVAALNNLAWHLRISDRPRAATYIQKAASLAPDHPQVLDTLAVIEFLDGDYRRAHRSIERALVGSPGSPSLLYHRAMIEAAAGEKAAAITQLQSLLADGATDFPERADAAALLAELKAG